jgi:hypothetical protein
MNAWVAGGAECATLFRLSVRSAEPGQMKCFVCDDVR